ncbi:MAG TPA: DUF4251 domain-containing protein [Bacteroidetes bacterium]|nr:DUF4251 domain-containing protein [Bacteroidota bacterium]
MKKFIYFLSLVFALTLFTANSGMAQNKQLTKKEQRKLEKQKKKEERIKKSLASRQYYAKLIKNKQFVFQATRLYGPYGHFYSVTPDINFVAIKDNKIILQFGFQGVVGWNGVGGITAEGFLTDYRFFPGKNNKQAMTVTAHIQPKFGGSSPYFTMNISNDGSADIQVTLENGGVLRMGGQVYAPSQASVYKGLTFP